MGRVIFGSIALAAAASVCSAACAMSPANNQASPCRVVGGEKLPAASGGPGALCAAIERAVSQRAPGVEFTAEVTVLSASRLAATLTSGGRKLPEQKFASMDRDLTVASFDRFAAALAEKVASGAR